MEGKKNMKILILSWRGPNHPNAGGAEISTHEHAKGWVKNGNSVTLFTSSYIGAKENEEIDGVKIIRRGNQILGVHFESLKWYLFEPHEEFDIVVDQFHGIPFFTPFFIRKKKIAFIHEVTKEVWRFNPWPKPFNLIPAVLGSFFEPLILKFFYKQIPFMSVSESTKKDLMDLGIPQKKITIIHNGLKAPKITLPKKEIEKTLIFLGALTQDKGIEKALDVFALLQKNIQENIQFWVVGKGNLKYEEFLKKKAKDLKKIKFWGYVDNKQKMQLLAKSYLLVNTSVREGWGLVVIEAASVGTPTVAFDVPGLRDSIIDGKTGVLSKDGSVESLVNIILSLLEDKKRYNNLSQGALLWSKQFSWEKSSKESLDLIRMICQS